MFASRGVHGVGACFVLRRGLLLSMLMLACSGPRAQAQTPAEGPKEDAVAKFEKSPWLIAPVFQSNPKLGTSLGAMAGYIHYFDEKSRPSIFAVMLQHSNTDSTVGGAFGKTSFDQDRQRLLAAIMYGYVRNDYNDYLGTGVPLKSNGELKSFIARYQYRVKGDWFLGVQAIYQNMAVTGETQFDDQFLNLVGVRPYKSGGAGLVAQYDSRDNDNSPTQGWLLNLNNMAYRESLGGDNNFDIIRGDIRYYMPHGKGNVLAFRNLNHFTSDAPTQAKAPVQLRGYKIGQYNGDYMSHIEVEERYRLAEKFTATLFVGVACTYGGGKDCSERENLYPAAGAGVQYVLKPKEGIVLNLEYAQGKAGNYGVYLKMGYAY
jgi:outer membrane protein assembly factor BamA